jgi:hypothetical protein
MGHLVSRQRQVLASIDGRATNAAVRRAVQVVGCGVDWNGNGTPFCFPPVFLIRLPGKKRLKFCPKNSKAAKKPEQAEGCWRWHNQWRRGDGKGRGREGSGDVFGGDGTSRWWWQADPNARANPVEER